MIRQTLDLKVLEGFTVALDSSRPSTVVTPPPPLRDMASLKERGVVGLARVWSPFLDLRWRTLHLSLTRDALLFFIGSEWRSWSSASATNESSDMATWVQFSPDMVGIFNRFRERDRGRDGGDEKVERKKSLWRINGWILYIYWVTLFHIILTFIFVSS